MLRFLRWSSSVHKSTSVVQGAALQVNYACRKNYHHDSWTDSRLQDYTVYGSKIKINIDIKDEVKLTVERALTDTSPQLLRHTISLYLLDQVLIRELMT